MARARAAFRALLLAGLIWPAPAQGSGDLPAVCDRAAAQAAQATGVPLSVLKAISLTESGRKRGGAFRPWPWTVNMEGKGLWFETEDEARAYVYRHYKRGARSFDIGCFQINFKWHGHEFTSIDEMFDPAANAGYAARFLAELFAETGSWSRAAGAYHSRTPAHAERYAARFDRFRAALRHEDAGPADIPEIPDIVRVANGGRDPGAGTRLAEARVNRFPLLQAGGTAGIGSLVPLGAGTGSLFGPPPQPQTVIE